MHLSQIVWSFQTMENKLLATNEFCQYLKDGKLNESIDDIRI